MDHQDVEPQRTIDAADPPDSRLLEVSDPLGQGPLSAPDPTRRGERRPDSGGASTPIAAVTREFLASVDTFPDAGADLESKHPRGYPGSGQGQRGVHDNQTATPSPPSTSRLMRPFVRSSGRTHARSA